MRTALVTCTVTFMAVLLTGCSGGPQFTGYIPPGGGIPPVPNITYTSPDLVIAGSASFALTVYGNNFASSSTIYVNGTPIPTTYVSESQLQATVASHNIAAAGTVPLYVTSATVSQSNTVDLTVESGAGFTLSNVPVQANDMAYDAASQQLYLSVQGGNPTAPDTVTALNPATGRFGVSQAAGANPDRLAVSGDGSYLYAGIDGSASVQRFLLPGLSSDISISIGSTSAAPLYAGQIAVAPGDPQTIAVLRDAPNTFPADQGGVVVYDNAVPRPTSVPGFDSPPNAEIDTLHWGATASQLFGAADDGNFDLYSLAVTPAGVQVANTFNGGNLVPGGSTFSIPNLQVRFDAKTGYLYNDSGAVIDPATGASVGAFAAHGKMAIDDALGIAYFFSQSQTQNDPQDYTLTAFNLTTFASMGSMVYPGVTGTPVKLVRWGSNGLAVLTNNNFTTPSSPIPGMGVYLISGSFVTNP